MKKQIGGDVVLAGGQKIPLSKAIYANGFIFLSGQLGFDTTGAIIAGGIEAQTRQALENIKVLLAQAEATLDDIVKVTVWLTDSADFSAFNQVYADFFPDMPPARSTVVSALLIPGALVEIEAIAIIS